MSVAGKTSKSAKSAPAKGPDAKVQFKRLSQIVSKTEPQRQQPQQKEQPEDNDDTVELVSLTSRGSDRRLSMRHQGRKSCTEELTQDDWLAVLLLVALVITAVFSGLCVALHGEGKRTLTDSRPFNMALLISGCIAMTLQLLCALMYASQWLSGV